MTLADVQLNAIGDALAVAAERRSGGRSRRPLVRLALVAPVAAALSVGVAIAAGVPVPNILDLRESSLGSASISSTPTTTAPLSDADRLILRDTGAGGNLTASLLAIRGSQAFWRVERSDGGFCFALGPAASAQAGRYDGGQTICSPTGDAPPFTPGVPIHDMSVYHGTATSATVAAFYGFAADQVARVGIVDGDGDVYSVPVSQNVYYLAPPDVPAGVVTALVALDSAGAVVYRQPIDSPVHAPNEPVPPVTLGTP
jgi:hypothetical protein